jgi:hypothetical protein
MSGNVQAVYHYPISPVLMLLVAFLICLVVADMTKIISVHSIFCEKFKVWLQLRFLFFIFAGFRSI